MSVLNVTPKLYTKPAITEKDIKSINLTNGKVLQCINTNPKYPIFDLDNIAECIGLTASDDPAFLKLTKIELEQYFDAGFDSGHAIEYEEAIMSLCHCSWRLLREISAHIALQPHGWTDICILMD